MPKETKATDPEINDRVTFIFEALVKGVLTTEMTDYVRQNHPEWNVGRSQVYEYSRAAKKRLAALSKRQHKYHLGKSLARLELLFQRNMTVQDYGTALQVEKERNKLMGLYAPAKVDVTSKGDALRGVVVLELKGAGRPPTTSEKDVQL